MHLTLISLWQLIESSDRRLFLLLNKELANPVFDVLAPYLRDSLLWAPLYLFLISFIVINHSRKGWWWVLFFVATVAFTDLCGTYGFKEVVRRVRPCNDPSFMMQVRLVLHKCSGGFSFLSNHAANHFGMATFIVCTLKKHYGAAVYLAYVWAAVIALSQVYVGVHYPLDILGGAALGILAGYMTAWIYQHNFGIPNPNLQKS